MTAMLECGLCGQEGGARWFRIDPENGVVCKAAKACEGRRNKPPDPLLQLMGLVLVGMQVAEIVQHPETMIEEMERYNKAIGGTLNTLLGQDEPDGS